MRRGGEKVIKGRKDVLVRDWKGNKGWWWWWGDMQNKQTRQQTGSKGGGVTKLALSVCWLLH